MFHDVYIYFFGILCWFSLKNLCLHRFISYFDEVSNLALVGHSSRDGIAVKIPYGVDVLLH